MATTIGRRTLQPPGVPMGSATPAVDDHLSLGISLQGIKDWFRLVQFAYDIPAMGEAGEEGHVSPQPCDFAGSYVRPHKLKWVTDNFGPSHVWYDACETARTWLEATQNKDRSVCEVLLATTAFGVHVGRATVFFSHVQSLAAGYKLATMERAFKLHPGALARGDLKFWIDLATLRQCCSGEFKLETIRAKIHKVRYTVVELCAQYLTRTFCIFEAFATLESEGISRSLLVITDSNQSKRQLQSDLDAGKLDVALAECRNQADKKKIDNWIRKRIGFGRLNSALASVLRERISRERQQQEGPVGYAVAAACYRERAEKWCNSELHRHSRNVTRAAVLVLGSHQLLVGLCQFCDYVTDLFALVFFRSQGDNVSFGIGLGFVVLSVLAAILWALLSAESRSCSRTICVICAAPFNLHIFVLALFAAADTWKTGENRQTRDDKVIFLTFKIIESLVESVPLSLLQVKALSHTWEWSAVAAAQASSLLLSVFSMSYGVFLYTIEAPLDSESIAADLKQKLARIKVFLAIFVRLLWSLVATASFLANEQLHPAIRVGVMVFLVAVYAILYIVRVGGPFDEDCDCKLALLVIFFLSFVGIAWLLVDVELLIPSNHTLGLGNFFAFAITRRVFLAALLGTSWLGLDAAQLPFAVPIAVALCMVDAMLNLPLMWAFHTSGEDIPDPEFNFFTGYRCCSCQLSANQTSEPQAIRDTTLFQDEPPRAVAEKIERQVWDMLGAVLAESTQPENMMTAPNVSQNPVLSVRNALLSMTGDVQHQLAMLLENYLPGTSEHADSAFYQQLEQFLQQGSATFSNNPSLASRSTELLVDLGGHDVRAAPLHAVLQHPIWQRRPGNAGAAWLYGRSDLSWPVGEVDYYVSHAWSDGASSKLRVLREFLCLNALLGRSAVASCFCALYFLALGLAINTQIPSFGVWWLPSVAMVPLLLTLIWATLSCWSVLPSTCTPWHFCPSLIWLDACCLSDDALQKIAAGVQCLEGFIRKSDRMIALVSAGYFAELRCVYELAMFCKYNVNLQSKLVMLSVDWPRTWNPCKQRHLLKSEILWFTTFRCRAAHCRSPVERAVILEAIRQAFTSEDQFDTFVQTEVRAVFSSCKKAYQWQLWRVGAESLQDLLVD